MNIKNIFKGAILIKAIFTMAVLAFILPSCKKVKELDGEWIVSEISGVDVASSEEQPFVNLNLSKCTYSGHTGVNLINGKFKAKGSKISFSDGAMTRMMGSPESMAVEDAFVQKMDEVRSYEIADSSTIRLKNSEGKSVITLTRKVKK